MRARRRRDRDMLMGRALLIEDLALLRTSYSEYLANRGLDVYTAHGSPTAWRC